MLDGYRTRRAESRDGPPVAALLAGAEETSDEGLSVDYHVDPLTAYGAFPDDRVTYLCETASGEVVAIVYCEYADRQFGDRTRPAGFSAGLFVHPEHRGQGVGSALMAWGHTRARDRVGDGGVLFGFIESSNDPSRGASETVAAADGRTVVQVRAPPNPAPADDGSEYVVRLVEPNEYATVATRSNAFYADYDGYRPLSEACVEDRAATTLDGESFVETYVCEDASGELVAGTTVLRYQAFMHVGYGDDATATEELRHCWHAPGKPAAMTALLDAYRGRYMDGDVLLARIDRESALADRLAADADLAERVAYVDAPDADALDAPMVL
jgi:GNAT superfamily N-acetyltransferase